MPSNLTEGPPFEHNAQDSETLHELLRLRSRVKTLEAAVESYRRGMRDLALRNEKLLAAEEVVASLDRLFGVGNWQVLRTPPAFLLDA